MTQDKKLTTEDFSNVWKDNCNTTESGLKLDLIQHLQSQRLCQEWVEAKQRVISTMKLDHFDDSQEIKILDIGCGLGIDVLLLAEEVSRLGKYVSIIGLDQNSTMLEEARKLYESQKGHLSSNVSVQIMRGDILQMEFSDNTFDIVRSDITLQHVDLVKALVEIKRVLKVGGRLIALEAGSGNTYSTDDVIVEMYDNVLPTRRDGGPAIKMQFMLPNMGFNITSLQPLALIQSGKFLASQDKDWVKLRGMGEMFVTKGIISEEQSKDFQKRYIEACETNQILSASIAFIVEATKDQ